MPEPHTIDECDEFSDYIDSIINVQSNRVGRTIDWKDGKIPTEKRIEWIRHWVENEQFMCFASSEYYLTRYARIRIADEQIIHFSFRKAQKIFFSALAHCDDLQIAIMLFVLKARQIGLSTVTAMCFLHRILFRTNTYAVMASVQAQQSDKLGEMVNTAWARSPWWLISAKTVNKSKEPQWANGSRLSIQSGTQEVGIAQGYTPSCVHISEIGDYPNPKRVLDEGLFPALHESPALFVVLEGTGSLEKTWQKEKWDYYSNPNNPSRRFTPFFIPPACAEDLYPPETWIKMNPIPAVYSPTDPCRRMTRRAELFVRQTDYLWRELGQHWEMDRQFQWYWDCLYSEAVSSHTEHQFLSQYAPTPEDAFQSMDSPVFTTETINLVTEAAKGGYKPYAITGRTILMGSDNYPYQADQREIDPTEDVLNFKWESNDGNQYDWDFVPLKQFDDSKDENCFDKLLIYRPPEPNRNYAIAIDNAYGLNTPQEDRLSITVHLNNNNMEPDDQVASFTSIRVNSPQSARIAAAIATLYGTDGRGNVTAANPLVCRFAIEQIRKPGDTCQNDLKIMGFLDHHPMHFYDKKGNVDLSKTTQEGWRTTRWSRSILLDRFVEAMNTGWLIIHDPIALRQLATFVRKYKEHGLAEMEHAVGCHDDNIFSNAICWTTNHDLDNTAARIQRRFPKKKKEDRHEDAWCTIQIVMS